MKKFFVLFILQLSFISVLAQTTLTHNICDDIIKVMDHSCTSAYIYFARDYYLDDFGVSLNEEFTITQGQVGVSYADGAASVQFNIYKIDDNFPASFSELDLIGQSQEVSVPYIAHSFQNIYNQIITVDFDVPVVVPANTSRILVEVFKGISRPNGSGTMHLAGTLQDDGAPSWYRGCVAGPNYINTDNFNTYPLWPASDYNFFINVTGNVINTTVPHSMYITNECTEILKEFNLTNGNDITSVIWNFGDPLSGASNTSNLISPTHDFSNPGQYTITATVTNISGQVYLITETIDVMEPPKAYQVDDIYACEDIFGSGISSTFDTSSIESQLIGGQSNVVASYVDGNGNEFIGTLPNTMTNSISNSETITLRVAHENRLCCYSEVIFNLITNPLPDVSTINDLDVCDDDNDGFAQFNLETIRDHLNTTYPNINIEFYDSNGMVISNSNLQNYVNTTPHQDTISIQLINSITDCLNAITIDLTVNPLPVANALETIIGCDDNGDGISENFDTSSIESSVLGNQVGMEVTYYDSNGVLLPNPLPNPFTNTVAFSQNITVRVTNINTNCHSETILQLETASQPNINQPQPLYACDEGNGIATFNTSNIESQLIGNQVGLDIYYFDQSGNPLPSPLPINYQNTIPYKQTINVRVENSSNTSCYSETSFDLIVNELPSINLEANYFICNLDPSMTLSVDQGYSSYDWKFEDDSTISSTNVANLIDEGDYTITVTNLENGINCSNTFSFHLTRSVLPVIERINYDELGNNFIEIIASGDGDFEYSIDGMYYQDSNYFDNVKGGTYTVYVRDKDGCGEDSEKVTLIDYPKYFTPNNDGYNDYWQIYGINNYPGTIIYIYDRYGKLLKQITSTSLGWDGTFNGELLSGTDYWFTADLGNGKTFKGHFSLKR